MPEIFGVTILVERRCVDQATLSPLCVHTTLQTDRSVHTNVALKDFTIVTNLLDGALQPLFVEAEHTAQVSIVETKHALQLRVISRQR